MLDDLARPPAERSLVLHRLGRSSRIQPRRSWASANAPEKWCRRWNSIWPPPNEKCSRRRWRSRAGQIEKAGEDGVSSDGARGEGAGEDRYPDCFGRCGSHRFANSARAITTRRSFSIRLPAANSRTIFLPRTRNRSEPHTSDSSRYLIDEAQLFIDAAHSCYNRIGNAGGRLGLTRETARHGDATRQRQTCCSRHPERVDLEPLIPIFHSWIQRPGVRRVAARRRRLPARARGPGRGLDRPPGRLQRGQHRQPPGRALQPQGGARWQQAGSLRQAARAALIACQRLEDEPRLGGKLRFNGREMEYSSTTACSRRIATRRSRPCGRTWRNFQRSFLMATSTLWPTTAAATPAAFSASR